jgi:DNA-binding Lrp family transcriptional regulator
MKELADHLDISWPTAKKRYDDIVNRGVIRKTSAIYEVEALGLQRITVLIQVKNYHKMQIMEQACTEHPYTHYRARAFGDSFGLLVQFDIPALEEGHENLVKFFEELNKLDIVADYQLLTSSGTRGELFPDLSRYKLDTASWDFSWKNWFQNIDNASTTLPSKKIYQKNFDEFTPLRFNVLRALNENGGLKQADLMETFDLSRTEAHRQYKFVKDNLIHSLRLNYDREYFDLTETYAIICTLSNEDDRSRFYNALMSNPPPFRIGIDLVNKDKMLIWTTISPAQASEFIFLVWKKYVSIKIFRISVSMQGSYLYWFYPFNFDFERKKWKTGDNYMVTDPINRLLSNKELMERNK